MFSSVSVDTIMEKMCLERFHFDIISNLGKSYKNSTRNFNMSSIEIHQLYLIYILLYFSI